MYYFLSTTDHIYYGKLQNMINFSTQQLDFIKNHFNEVCATKYCSPAAYTQKEQSGSIESIGERLPRVSYVSRDQELPHYELLYVLTNI